MQDATNARPLPRISPSSIADLGCIKKFHTLRYLNQWPKDGNGFAASAQFGTAVHSVLKNLYDPRNPVRPDLDKIDAYAREAIYSWRYTAKESRQEDLDRCVRIVRSYAEQDDFEDAYSTIAVERSGEALISHNGIGRFFLTARFDRVIARGTSPDHLVVRDYKFGQPKIKLEEAFLQLWTAKLLFPDYRTYSVEIDWIDLDGRVERDVITVDDLRGVFRNIMKKIMRVVSAIESDNIMVEPGDCCVFCPLRAECQPLIMAELDSSSALFATELEKDRVS